MFWILLTSKTFFFIIIIEKGEIITEGTPLELKNKYAKDIISIYNVEEKDLQGESSITNEHIQNNKSVRKILGERGIKPENLPPSEDMKKLKENMEIH